MSTFRGSGSTAAVLGTGCLTYFGAALIMAIPSMIVGRIYDLPEEAAMTPSIIIGLIVAAMVMVRRSSQLDRQAFEREYASRVAASQHRFADRSREAEVEATRTSKVLRDIYANATVRCERANKCAEAVSRALRVAEDEYAARAYAPFWDAVQSAIESLRAGNLECARIAEDAKRYRALLNERDHDFPPFPLRLSQLPDFKLLATGIAATIRRGQTDYQFAMVFEQRAIRGTLVSGVQNVVAVLADLEDAFDSGYREVVSALRASAEMASERAAGLSHDVRRVAEATDAIARHLNDSRQSP